MIISINTGWEWGQPDELDRSFQVHPQGDQEALDADLGPTPVPSLFETITLIACGKLALHIPVKVFILPFPATAGLLYALKTGGIN